MIKTCDSSCGTVCLAKIYKSAYIGIGSNLGDKLENCRKAIQLVGKISGCRLMARSDFFRTAPVGVEGHDWYVNGVISLEAEIPAYQLLKSLLAIEADLGRERKKKWDPRTIDLDILLFGQDVIDEKDLTVPHPLHAFKKICSYADGSIGTGPGSSCSG